MVHAEIHCHGVDHSRADVSFREKIATAVLRSSGRHTPSNAELDVPVFTESVVLSTCNRVEWYTVSSDPGYADRMYRYIADVIHESSETLRKSMYHLTGQTAVEHVCRVAAGLESLVLGETEVLGQVSRALRDATETATVGPILAGLFQAAVRAGKRARSETEIARNAAGIGSVAAAKALEATVAQTDPVVLLAGAGEIGTACLKSLSSRGVKKIRVASRSVRNAEDIARRWGAEAYGLEAVPELLSETDIVVYATATDSPIAARSMVERAMRSRPNRSLVVLDIGVPRNVDPAVATISGVTLFDIDDLRGAVDAGLARREKEVPAVESIVEDEVRLFEEGRRCDLVRPMISAIRRTAESQRKNELDRLLAGNPCFSSDQIEHLERFSKALVRRVLELPSESLRDAARSGRVSDAILAAQTLFPEHESRPGL